MVEDQRLLVVDDEEAICEGCRRIFSRQGFQVEKTSDARHGLSLAEEKDYAAILLDIKMPTMSGIEFLEALRTKKPDVPVIFMTGYPSVPNAMSAIRLGAAGYVTKPFTPEEISQVVHKHLKHPAAVGPLAGDRPVRPEAWTPAAEGFSFWNDSWLQPGEDGSVRIGAMIPRADAADVRSVRLPRLGEAVYQGLPVTALTLADGRQIAVPAPISGIVVAINEELSRNPAALANEPCTGGWVASICPTRFDEEMKNCTRRRVLLVSSDAAAAHAQQTKLAALGCQVRVASRWEELASPLADDRFGVLLLDAASLGEGGPAMVGRINAAAPAVKVVLVSDAQNTHEAAYRSQRIFYYAVEPFADNEIAEILDAAFCQPRPAPREYQKVPPGNIAYISLINRNGTKVRLAAAPGLLRRDQGLGLEIRQKLLDRLFPIETILGDTKINAADITRAAATCDRLVVVLAKEVGRLPGSLVRDTKFEFISVAGDGAGNVTTLVVEPVSLDSGLDGFDVRTKAALAEHIVNDLASY